jgi:hypothetical protein
VGVNRSISDPQVSLHSCPHAQTAYRLSGVRHKGGVNLIHALMWNVGNCRPDVKGEAQVEDPQG